MQKKKGQNKRDTHQTPIIQQTDQQITMASRIIW
jgi:hypothetical protein